MIFNNMKNSDGQKERTDAIFKADRKRKTLALIFAAVAAIFVAITVIYLIFAPTETKSPTVFYQTEGVVRMKKGEKLSFEDACPEFKQYRDKTGQQTIVRSQLTLLGREDVRVSEVSMTPMITNNTLPVYVDESGYICAADTGVYTVCAEFGKLRYYGANQSEFFGSVYCVTVAVYEAEEKDYTPLDNAFANQYSYDQDGSYMITEDITLNYDYLRNRGGVFSGIIVNPYGHTITLDIKSRIQCSSLFPYNYGILDGLIFDIKNIMPAIGEDFNLLCEKNTGLIYGCKVSGEIRIENYATEDEYKNAATRTPEISLIPSSGFVIDNDVSLTVYSDGTINAYDDEYHNFFAMKGNKVSVNAYYYENKLLCSRRNLRGDGSKYGVLAYNSLECFGKAVTNAAYDYKVVFIKRPKGTAFEYSLPTGGVMEINPQYNEGILSQLSDGTPTEVIYWTINGTKYDDLQSLEINENIEAIPCVKYKTTTAVSTYTGTSFLVSAVHCADKQLVLPAIGDGKTPIKFQAGVFENYFNDPFCVIPEKIVIPRGYEPCDEAAFSDASAEALEAFILSGGELSIESGNKSMYMVDKKSLCSADGKTLLKYFHADGQTELKLHPQITKIGRNAFIKGNTIKDFDFTGVSDFEVWSLKYCLSAENISFGKTAEVFQGSLRAFDIRSLIGELPSIKSVSVSADNERYSVINSCVIGDNAELIYLPKTIGGDVVIPEGVERVFTYNGIFGPEVTSITFPSTMTMFNSGTILNSTKIRSLVFKDIRGASADGLLQISGSNLYSSYPDLTSVRFEGAARVVFSSVPFRGADNAVIYLADKAEDVTLSSGVFCKAFIADENNINLASENGVLFNKDKSIIYAYPLAAKAVSYEAPAGVEKAWYYAFSGEGSALENVTFPSGFSDIMANCFKSSYVKNVVCGDCPTGLTVDSNAFSGCKKLVSFVSGSETTKLSERAFQNCTSLDFVEGKDVQLFGACVFESAGISRFDISESEPTLPQKTFYGCINLKKIDLKNVKFIGNQAFEKKRYYRNIKHCRYQHRRERLFKVCVPIKRGFL